MEIVIASCRDVRLVTILCLASTLRGAADEYRSGRRLKMMGIFLPDADITGYVKRYASRLSSTSRNCASMAAGSQSGDALKQSASDRTALPLCTDRIA